MKLISVRNPTRDALLGDRVALADSYWSRLRGLLGRPAPSRGEGLLIAPSRGVHMYGMRYPLDVLLLDGAHTVTALYPGLAPWRRTRVHHEARFALELPVGTIAETDTREGDRLTWTRSNGAPDAN